MVRWRAAPGQPPVPGPQEQQAQSARRGPREPPVQPAPPADWARRGAPARRRVARREPGLRDAPAGAVPGAPPGPRGAPAPRGPRLPPPEPARQAGVARRARAAVVWAPSVPPSVAAVRPRTPVRRPVPRPEPAACSGAEGPPAGVWQQAPPPRPRRRYCTPSSAPARRRRAPSPGPLDTPSRTTDR
jgi:hypothetical protein